MYLRKLKPSGGIGGLWIPIVTVIFFFIFVAFLSPKAGSALLILVFLLWSQFAFVAFIRTKNFTYLFSGLFTLIYPGFLAFVPHLGVLGESKPIAFFSLILATAFCIGAFIGVFTGNFKWRGRELFELIARDVDVAENGFTSRPHPIGNFEYKREEIVGFVNYMQSKLLGLAVIDDQKIYIVPVKNGSEYLMLYKSGYHLLEGSWIVFHNNGEVSVQISKADYLDYREALSFNLLCNSMGELFLEFLEHYRRGEEVRIIDKLKSINTGIFS